MISVIIPTYNEQTCIETTLLRLKRIDLFVERELIVADGGSTDLTTSIAAKHASVIPCARGRAMQQNTAAKYARGEVLFFAHADMQVPYGALAAIKNQMNNGYDGGGFSNVFDVRNQRIKKLGSLMNVRFFDKREKRPGYCIFYGDNGIFVRKEVFQKLNGFKEIPIMEDYDFSIRLKKYFRVKRIVEPKLIVSSRRHINSGFFFTRFQWIAIRKLYQCGVSPNILAGWYKDVR